MTIGEDRYKEIGRLLDGLDMDEVYSIIVSFLSSVGADLIGNNMYRDSTEFADVVREDVIGAIERRLVERANQ